MFTAQIDYWNDMMKKVQDAYTGSFNSGAECQREYSRILKEMMDATGNIGGSFHREAVQIGTRMVEGSMDQMSRFSRFYMDRMEENFEQVRDLMEKHNVKNEDFRKELEFIWKENMDTFNKQTQEMMNLVQKTQKDSTEEIFRLYREFSKKGMEEISRRMESMEKTPA